MKGLSQRKQDYGRDRAAATTRTALFAQSALFILLSSVYKLASIKSHLRHNEKYIHIYTHLCYNKVANFLSSSHSVFVAVVAVRPLGADVRNGSFEEHLNPQLEIGGQHESKRPGTPNSGFS